MVPRALTHAARAEIQRQAGDDVRHPVDGQGHRRHLDGADQEAVGPGRHDQPIAGDQAAAKALVTAFLDAIGYDAVDAGDLAESWRFERDTPAYGVIYFSKSPADRTGIPDGAPVNAAALRAALAAAQRLAVS